MYICIYIYIHIKSRQLQMLRSRPPPQHHRFGSTPPAGEEGGTRGQGLGRDYY